MVRGPQALPEVVVGGDARRAKAIPGGKEAAPKFEGEVPFRWGGLISSGVGQEIGQRAEAPERGDRIQAKRPGHAQQRPDDVRNLMPHSSRPRNRRARRTAAPRRLSRNSDTLTTRRSR